MIDMCDQRDEIQNFFLCLLFYKLTEISIERLIIYNVLQDKECRIDSERPRRDLIK